MSYLPTLSRKVFCTHMTQKCIFYQCDTKKVVFINRAQKGHICQPYTERFYLPKWPGMSFLPRSYLTTLHIKVVFTHMTQKCIAYKCDTKKDVFINRAQKGHIYQPYTERLSLPTWHRNVFFTNVTQRRLYF